MKNSAQQIRTEEDWYKKAVSMRSFNAMYAHNQHIPSSKRVIWLSDKPGFGLCMPKSRMLTEWMMSNYGIDCVAYTHGEPDFEPFVPTIYPTDLMSDDFARYRREKLGKNQPIICVANAGIHCQFSLEDTISTNRKANKQYCFMKIAEFMGGNLHKDDVEDYFRYKGLTCHEPSDLHTLQIIPRRINDAFTHTAGISTSKHVDLFLDPPIRK